MATRQDRRRLLGPAIVQRVSFSSSNVCGHDEKKKSEAADPQEDIEEKEDKVTVVRNILHNTANSSVLYSATNSKQQLALLSSLYVKPYKQQFVEKCVINVNFEGFGEVVSAQEQFVQEFLESTIILAEYPKTGLDFFIKNVTTSNAIKPDFTLTQPSELLLLKHIFTATILVLLEANVSLKHWPAVGVSKSRKTIAVYVKNETEIVTFLSHTSEEPEESLAQELADCFDDARDNRAIIRGWF
ncbi:hypothetical protein QEN19_001671 [Hanseniaspora menglaensis]